MKFAIMSICLFLAIPAVAQDDAPLADGEFMCVQEGTDRQIRVNGQTDWQCNYDKTESPWVPIRESFPTCDQFECLNDAGQALRVNGHSDWQCGRATMARGVFNCLTPARTALPLLRSPAVTPDCRHYECVDQKSGQVIVVNGHSDWQCAAPANNQVTLRCVDSQPSPAVDSSGRSGEDQSDSSTSAPPAASGATGQ